MKKWCVTLLSLLLFTLCISGCGGRVSTPDSTTPPDRQKVFGGISLTSLSATPLTSTKSNTQIALIETYSDAECGPCEGHHKAIVQFNETHGQNIQYVHVVYGSFMGDLAPGIYGPNYSDSTKAIIQSRKNHYLYDGSRPTDFLNGGTPSEKSQDDIENQQNNINNYNEMLKTLQSDDKQQIEKLFVNIPDYYFTNQNTTKETAHEDEAFISYFISEIDTLLKEDLKKSSNTITYKNNFISDQFKNTIVITNQNNALFTIQISHHNKENFSIAVTPQESPNMTYQLYTYLIENHYTYSDTEISNEKLSNFNNNYDYDNYVIHAFETQTITDLEQETTFAFNYPNSPPKIGRNKRIPTDLSIVSFIIETTTLGSGNNLQSNHVKQVSKLKVSTP